MKNGKISLMLSTLFLFFTSSIYAQVQTDQGNNSENLDKKREVYLAELGTNGLEYEDYLELLQDAKKCIRITDSIEFEDFRRCTSEMEAFIIEETSNDDVDSSDEYQNIPKLTDLWLYDKQFLIIVSVGMGLIENHMSIVDSYYQITEQYAGSQEIVNQAIMKAAYEEIIIYYQDAQKLFEEIIDEAPGKLILYFQSILKKNADELNTFSDIYEEALIYMEDEG